MSPSKGCWIQPELDEQMAAGRDPFSARRQEYFLTPSPTDSPLQRRSPERNCLIPNPSSLCFNKNSELAQKLLANMTGSACVQMGKISMTDLANILNIEVVFHELRDLAGKRTAQEMAEKIITTGRNCQGILAILILINKTSQIHGFVNQTFPTIPNYQDCGMSDQDLPLVMMYDESKSKVVLRREDYPEAHLDCFDEFTPEEIVAFSQWQWSVLNEEQYLERPDADRPSSRCTKKWHYNYNANDQLPVVKPKKALDSALIRAVVGEDTNRTGRNGPVSLWTLADPTRSRPIPDGAGNIHQKCQVVAVKQSLNAKSFLWERRAAALISTVPHPHIVPLLFSYSHLEKSYLVFPWATSNLAEYWDTNKLYLQDDRSTMEYSRVLWVAEQCEGLADALSYIHRFVSVSEDDSTRVVRTPHGNIKPENILVFCRPHRQPVLQIADFGSILTYTTAFSQHGQTPTDADHGAGDYTAPEVYFGETASSKSDVWSLCCVFLDFVEWIMPSQSAPGQPKRVLTDFEEDKGMCVQGREAVRDWRRSRVDNGSGDVVGYFFDTLTGELNIWVDTWLHDAQDNALCSNWMCNLVGYLDASVLQQEADKRISSRALYGGLLDLRMSCQDPVNGRRFATEPING